MSQQTNIELGDFLKGFSMFSIVVFHILKVLNLPPLVKEMIFFGGTGVHTFILISGFGLTLSWIRKPLRYPEYLKKRFVKIYVPYIFIVSVTALTSLIIPIYHATWYSYFGHVLLYKMFAENIVGSFGDHFWFLSTIFQFYIIFPLLVKIKGGLSNSWFFITGLLISLAWIIIVLLLGRQEMRTWNSFFLQYLWEFMLGMLLALFYANRQKMPEIRIVPVALIAGAGIVTYAFLALKMGSVGKMVNDIPALIGFTFFGVLIYSLKILPLQKIFIYTGSISFSLYLIHILTLKIGMYVLHVNGHEAGIISSVIILAASYGLAHLLNAGTQRFYAWMKI